MGYMAANTSLSTPNELVEMQGSWTLGNITKVSPSLTTVAMGNGHCGTVLFDLGGNKFLWVSSMPTPEIPLESSDGQVNSTAARSHESLIFPGEQMG